MALDGHPAPELLLETNLGIRDANTTCHCCRSAREKPEAEPLANVLLLESVLPVLQLHYEYMLIAQHFTFGCPKVRDV